MPPLILASVFADSGATMATSAHLRSCEARRDDRRWWSTHLRTGAQDTCLDVQDRVRAHGGVRGPLVRVPEDGDAIGALREGSPGIGVV